MRRVAVLLIFLLVATACGQKAGVHVGFAGGQPAGAGGGAAPAVDANGVPLPAGTDPAVAADTTMTTTDPGATGTAPAGTTTTTDPGNGTTTAPAGDTGGSTAPQSTGGEAPPPSSGGGQQPPQGESAPPPQGGDSTGVSDTKIKIGFHAPITGAAPLPQASFKKGLVQYWDYHGKDAEVEGRRVEVIVRDDTYNPSRATTVCKQMIEQDKVFILGGAGGADQIAACARVAAQYGVPYISAGVDEGILRQLPNYFAFSMSYPAQAPLLMQWVAKNAMPSNKKFAIIRDRTPSFNNVVNAVKAEAEKLGMEVLLRQVQNGPSDGQWLQQNGIETAFPIMSPSTWIQIVNAPGGSIKNWVGVGLTMGLNTVANAGCPAIDGAMFFSPFPGLNQANNIDPDFRKAGGEDDIQWALWGSNKLLHTLLLKMSGTYTRQAFVQAMETRVETGIYPPSNHKPGNHFAIDQVHMLRANCSARQWQTPDDGLFVSGF